MKKTVSNRTGTTASVLLTAVLSAVFISALYNLIRFGFYGAEKGFGTHVGDLTLIESSMMCAAMLVLIIMLISCIFVKNQDKTARIFIMMITVNIFFLYFDMTGIFVDGSLEWRMSNIAVNFGYYICVIILSWAYWHFVLLWSEPQQKKKNFKSIKSITHAIDFLSCCQIALIVGNAFGEYFFYVDNAGFYRKSPSFITCFFCPTAIMLICLFFILTQKTRASEKITLISYTLIPYLGAVITALYDDAMIMSLLSFVAVMIIYSNLFVRRERTLAVKEKELAESEVNSMLLQINPHFIYNTLGSIEGLCTDDPEAAKKLLCSFSDYLRNNFGEMARKKLIPFKTELEHLKSYVKIEQVRFPDISVEFNISSDDFLIPSLSVQPLVENAISHGLMGRETGGTVRISSYDNGKNHIITVEDDGIGFDPDEISPKRNHIGISNVRNRLEMLCGGSLTVASIKGVGTFAEITIPKGEK